MSLSVTHSPEQIADSRAELREFGNRSSATILFVLNRILLQSGKDGHHPICAMAFGPGLTIETALLERMPEYLSSAFSRRQAHAFPAAA